MESCVQLGAPHIQERHRHNGESSAKAKEYDEGTQYISYKERLRVLRLFVLEKAQEDLINVYKYLQGQYKTKWSQAFFTGAQFQD